MANKHAIHRAGRDRAVKELLTMERDGIRLTGTGLQIAAESCGYSVRQLKRVLAAERAHQLREHNSAQSRNRQDDDVEAQSIDPEGPWQVTSGLEVEVFARGGNLEGTYHDLEKEGVKLPSLSTFKRKINARIGAYGMEVARKGEGAARQRRVYLQRAPEGRGHTYETDHTEAPIWVIPSGHLKARRPYLTGVIDAATGYALAIVITFGTPTAEEVRAAFISAIHTRTAPDGLTLVGGLPTRIVWDQGKDFLSELVTVSCLRLGTEPCPLPPYSPNLKPHIERFWRFIKENLMARLAGYIDAGADVRGNLERATHALSEAAFVEAVTEWVDWYNTEHRQRETRLTALQRWQADPRDLVTVPDDQLWQDFLLFNDNPKVSTKGVKFQTIQYVTLGGELDKLIGRRVQVRYLPHQRDFVEIFHDGHYVATGYPSDKLLPENREEFLRQRSADARRARENVSSVKRLHKQDPNTSKLHKTKKGGHTAYEVLDPDALRTGQKAALDSYRPPIPRGQTFDTVGQGVIE